MSETTPEPGSLSATWDEISDDYLRDVRPFLDKFAVTAVDALVARRRDDGAALDLACGPGTASVHLAEHFREVRAVDFSDRMLALCRSSVAGLPVTVEHADGQALPHADGSFDAALSMFGLMFFPDRERGFAELQRVLRPGAPVLVAAWAPPGDSALIRAIAAAMAPSFPELLDRPAAPPALEDPATFAGELTSAGFEDVSIQSVRHKMDGVDGERMWAAIEASFFPIRHARASFGERWESSRQEMIARFVEQTGPGPCALESCALFGHGRRGS